MQPNMNNPSDQIGFGNPSDIFRYTTEVPDYFYLAHKCNPDWATNASDSHFHPFCEITIYLQDLKCLFVNDSMYVSQNPCFFTFRPGERHYAIHSKPSRHERYVMKLYQDSFFQLPGGRELLRCLFDRNAGEHNMIILPEKDQQEAFRLLDRILSQKEKGLPEQQALMMSDMIRFLSLLNQYYQSDTTHITSGISELLRQILSYIGSNLSESLQVTALAQQFNISQSTLERMFRNSLTMSPKEYIIRCRMDAAREYLRQGQSVTDACSHAGFGDYSHFIADFRKLNGITPAEYAKRYRHKG